MPYPLRFLPPVMILALVAACSPISLVAGAGASVGVSAAQERGLSGTLDDTKIHTQIDELWLGQSPVVFKDVSLEVIEGTVTLTGTVKTPSEEVDAVRLAWQAPGVRQVNDDIQVTDKSSIVDYTRDVNIHALLSARLLLDKNVKNINYTTDVVNGVVYLMGIAQDQTELDRVIAYARDIRGVNKVVNNVILKTDPSRVSS